MVEVMGGWGKELQDFWKDLLQQMDAEADACGEDKISDSFAAKWLPKIAVSVQRGNALAIPRSITYQATQPAPPALVSGSSLSTNSYWIFCSPAAGKAIARTTYGQRS